MHKTRIRKRIRKGDEALSVEFEDHSGEILQRLAEAKEHILRKVGAKAVDYAQDLCPVGTVESVGSWAPKNGKGKRTYRGGTLRNSINYRVDGDVLSIGSDVEYAPYVELGTGPHFKPPPEWEDFDVPPSKGTGRSYVKPRPYIRPAIEDHAEEYEKIAEQELKKV